MITLHIDLLHVCETNEIDGNFSSSNSKASYYYPTPIPNSFSKGFYIIANPHPSTRGGGSKLIISSHLHKHLQQTTILVPGRMIALKFSFKYNTSFSIITTYLPSSHDNTYNEMCHELYKFLKVHNFSNRHYFILLGDFNIPIHTKKHKMSTNIAASFPTLKEKSEWNDRLLFTLLHEHLINVASPFQKTHINTHFPDDTNKQPSTIDYIFASKNAILDLIHFDVTPRQYSSDHRLLLSSWINPTNFCKDRKAYTEAAKKKRSHNEIYNIKDLSTDDWITIHNLLNNRLQDLHIDASQFDSPQYYVNHEMRILIQAIKDTFKTVKVKTFKRGKHNRSTLPLPIHQLYNQIYQLNGIIALLKDFCTFNSPNFDHTSTPLVNIQQLNQEFSRHWRRKLK